MSDRAGAAMAPPRFPQGDRPIGWSGGSNNLYCNRGALELSSPHAASCFFLNINFCRMLRAFWVGRRFEARRRRERESVSAQDARRMWFSHPCQSPVALEHRSLGIRRVAARAFQEVTDSSPVRSTGRSGESARGGGGCERSDAGGAAAILAFSFTVHVGTPLRPCHPAAPATRVTWRLLRQLSSHRAPGVGGVVHIHVITFRVS